MVGSDYYTYIIGTDGTYMEVYKVNTDYSAFYRGETPAKTYGAGNTGRQTQVVKYEFNTTDEHGNKIMDKMSREETLQAMNDIRSQYHGDVIVEFSGDGMAALVDSRKGYNGDYLDKIMKKAPEQQIVPEDMITRLEGTYQKVSANDEVNTHVSWHDTLREKAPDVCDELDDLMQQILVRGLNRSSNGEKLGEKFVELVKKAENAISTYDAKKKNAVDNTNNAATVGETQLSEKAQALLKKLREGYGDMDFFVANFNDGDNAADIMSKSGKAYSVILTVEELERMASDKKYEKEYIDRVQDARNMAEQINKEYGFVSSGETTNKIKVGNIGISINEDGTITFLAELEKSSQREEAIVQANNIEELIKKIKEWNKVIQD